MNTEEAFKIIEKMTPHNIQLMERQLSEARQALGFYAQIDNYAVPALNTQTVGDYGSLVQRDQGTTARRALKGVA